MLESLPNEIVIVRRKNSWEDDGPPHGVWKIAYADFMTALMAFFLVMWLINVTDDSVRRGVAQYFNPVKLASTAPNRKGLNDPLVNGETNENGTTLFNGKLGGSDQKSDVAPLFGDGSEEGHVPTQDVREPSAASGKVPGEFSPRHAESVLFTDPYAVLDTLSREIRVAISADSNPAGIGAGLQRQEGALGGEAYRDPFDPQFWQFRPGRGVDGNNPEEGVLPGQGNSAMELTVTAQAAHATSNLQPASPASIEAVISTPELSQDTLKKLGQGHASSSDTVARDESDATESKGSRYVAHIMAGRHDESLQGGQPAEQPDRTRKQGRHQRIVSGVSDILRQTDGTRLAQTAAKITVAQTEEGTLISLTDDANFGMFAIGSAEPRPELVALLEKIGAVIARETGEIVIKGHTDARPFKSGTYDNWRLSTARAHMALYMLTRGGVAGERFERVEGYADRDLKNTDDPFAAGNRRVEIFLKEPHA